MSVWAPTYLPPRDRARPEPKPAFAEGERDRIRERITTVNRDQKARGRYLGGQVPASRRPALAGPARFLGLIISSLSMLCLDDKTFKVAIMDLRQILILPALERLRRN
jgi:DNA invertase Pin-like site-specific DNA recombinase